MLRLALLCLMFAGFGWVHAQSPSKPLSDPKKTPVADPIPHAVANDVELVERLIFARRNTRTVSRRSTSTTTAWATNSASLWIEKELMSFHLQWKPSYNLDVKDVPPPNLEAKVNVREANELYRAALEYKGKGFGEDYVLNQRRRAEIYLREILEKYPNSDKIADVAYQLGDIYESRDSGNTTGPRSTSSDRSSG